jgi:signal transduction histidine kinase
VEASRNVVNSVCFRKDGSLWAGTDGAGIYCWRGTNRLHFAAAQGLSSLDVSAMIESADTNLYAATAGGLFKLAGNGFEAAVLPSRAKDACRSLMNDRDGDLWVGTQHGIVKVGVFQTEIIGLGGRRPFYVGCFAQNNSGDIYVAGVGGGVFQLAGTNLNRLQTSSGIRLQSVRSIAFDSVNDLWGGSSGESLICREGEKYYQWNYQDDHLPSNHHFALLADDGIIWVSSENGIFGCPVEGLKKYNRNASNPLTVWRLTTADGLAEKVCSGGGQPAASRSPNGWLWFPDGSTVAGFDPRKVTKKMPVFAPLLESVYVDGGLMNLPSDSKLKLKSGAERFEFHFTSPNLIAPERLRFRYQLAGLDADWVNVENRRVAYYTHLPPGDYTFKSQVSGPSGEWKEQPVGFRIQIFPRFWERTSFRVGIVVVSLFLVGVVAWAVERSRSRRRLERLEMQRKLDKERQRIARDIHDDLGSGLTEIIMMSDIAELEGGSNSVVSKTKKIAERARTLTRAMDEVVWALNPRNDSFESFLTYLNRWAQSYLNHARINCRWDIPLDIPEIPLHADLRHHLFLACKEALNNAVKYAKATEIWIRCELTESQITLSVEDNGVGFAVNTPSERGNGLKNMRQRLEELNGRCEIESAAERGTIIRFQVPRSEESTRR